jgi:diguanylate cyclase (GGDEF)-like protein
MPFRSIVDLSFDPACLVDEGGRLIHVNEAFRDILGLHAFMPESGEAAFPSLIGQAAYQDIARNAMPGEPLFKRLTIRAKDCCQTPVEANCLRLPEGGGILVVMRLAAGTGPVSNAEHQALHDALTGLPNRLLLIDRLRQSLSRAKRHKDYMAVMFIDLDGFKPINDTFGHECGDEVLKATAARLLEAVRGEDTAARIGGDEFVMVLTELKNGLHAGLTANRVIKSITQPIEWRGREVRVSASLGVSIGPTDGQDPETLLKRADEAMYVAKKSGKNGYSFYNESSYFE